MFGIKVLNGSDTVVLTVPLSSTYSNYNSLDFSGFTGSVIFTNQASNMYIYGTFKVPNITITNQPTTGYFLNGLSNSFISLNRSSFAQIYTSDNVNYIQDGILVCPAINFNFGGTITYNNTGTINITTFLNGNHNFVGPVSASFGTFYVSSVTGTGSITINTETWQHVNSSTLPASTVVNVSADNGIIVNAGTVNYPYTINILGAGTGGTRLIQGSGFNTGSGYDLNITTGSGTVSLSNEVVCRNFNTTGMTVVSLSGIINLKGTLTIPQTVTTDLLVAVSGSSAVLNASNVVYSLKINYDGVLTLYGVNNFTNLTNYGNLNFGSSTVTVSELLYIPYVYDPGTSIFFYSTTNLGSSTINIKSSCVIDAHALTASSAGTSTINLSSNLTALILYGNRINNLNIAASGTHYIREGGYIANLTNSVSPATIRFDSSFDFGAFALSGTSGNPVTVTRYIVSPQLSKTTAWVVGANSVDAGNNVGNISYTGSSPDWLVLSYLTVGYLHITTINELSNASDNIREGAGAGTSLYSVLVETATTTATDTLDGTAIKKAIVTGSSSGSDSLIVRGGFYPQAVQEFSSIKNEEYYYDYDLEQGFFLFGVTVAMPYSDSFVEDAFIATDIVDPALNIFTDLSEITTATDTHDAANFLDFSLSDSSTASETSKPGFVFATENNEFASSQDIVNAKNILTLLSSESAQALDIYSPALFLLVSANVASASSSNANLNLKVPLSTVDGTGAALNKVLVSASADIALNKILAFLNGQGVITNALLADLKLTKPISSSVISLVSTNGQLSLASNLTSFAAVKTTVDAAPVTVGKTLSVYALVTPSVAGNIQLTKPLSGSAFSATLFDSLLAVYHAVDLEKYSATTAEVITNQVYAEAAVTTIYLDVVPQTISADVVSLEIHLVTPNTM